MLMRQAVAAAASRDGEPSRVRGAAWARWSRERSQSRSVLDTSPPGPRRDRRGSHVKSPPPRRRGLGPSDFLVLALAVAGFAATTLVWSAAVLSGLVSHGAPARVGWQAAGLGVVRLAPHP